LPVTDEYIPFVIKNWQPAATKTYYATMGVYQDKAEFITDINLR
jgi:hypothetical protein